MKVKIKEINNLIDRLKRHKVDIIFNYDGEKLKFVFTTGRLFFSRRELEALKELTYGMWIEARDRKPARPRPAPPRKNPSEKPLTQRRKNQ